MKNIRFLDLKEINEPIIGEIKSAFEEVLASGWYVLGEKLNLFEKNLAEKLSTNFLEEGYCVGCNSGTDAIVLSLLAGGVKSGDEVITVSHTAIPTISAIISIGAKPIFVDINSKTWVMNTEELEILISEKTKAIVCVHLYGNMVDVFKVKSLLKKIKREDILIIEDVAQAQGASWGEQQAGTIGDFGAFSFYPSKNIGALGDGGAVFTKNREYYTKLKQYRFYGQEDRYNAVVMNGINSRLDEVQAAILDVKLKYLSQWNEQKNILMNCYRTELKDLPVKFQEITGVAIPAWHLCVIEVNNINRDCFVSKLNNMGLQTLIHYPIPTHLQKAFSNYNTDKLPVTEKIAGRIVSLPFNHIMTEENVKEISRIIKSVF